MRTRGASAWVGRTATRLARLDEQRLVRPEPLERGDDGRQRLRASRRPSAAAVDDERRRILGDVGVEVVQEAAKRPLLLPAAATERASRRQHVHVAIVLLAHNRHGDRLSRRVEGAGRGRDRRGRDRAAARGRGRSSGSTSHGPEDADMELLARRVQLPPPGGRGLASISPSGRRSTSTTTSSSSSSTAPSPDEDRPRRGALLLLRPVPRHRAPRRLPRLRRGPASGTSSASTPIDRPGALLYQVVDGLVDSFFPLLDRVRRPHRRARGRDLRRRRRRAAAGDLRDEARARRHAEGGLARSATSSRALVAGSTELPGLTDEDERYFRDVYDHLIRISDTDRQLPRPADRRDGRLPLDRLEPPQRRDEAAHDHRHDLHAADLPHRLLRPELRVDGRARRRPRTSSPSGSG